MHRTPRAALAAILWALGAPPDGHAQDAASVFARYAGAVAKVEVLEPRTATPQSVGTAFFVGPTLAVTNFHVVRDFVFRPSSSIVQMAFRDGTTTRELSILAVDPVQDLAVIQMRTPRDQYLSLATQGVDVGETLYSLGHPADLSTSVVQGIFNGAVEHSASPRYHFTGSINPGMSGGPTITAGGAVVGINVSTAGNQLSFLVPAASLAPLLDDAAMASGREDDLRDSIGERLHAFQADFFDRLLAGPLPTTTIGSLEVPVGPDSTFDCSATPYDIEDDIYQVIEHTCFTNDEIMVGPDGSFPLAYLEHMYISSDELPGARFMALYNSWFQALATWELPENEDATSYRCETDNTRATRGGKLRLVVCMRRHARFADLYDVFIRTALLTDGSEGAVGTFRAFALSFTNATRLMGRMIEGYRWQTP